LPAGWVANSILFFFAPKQHNCAEI
jgi:hypothetical protein